MGLLGCRQHPGGPALLVSSLPTGSCSPLKEVQEGGQGGGHGRVPPPIHSCPAAAQAARHAHQCTPQPLKAVWWLHMLESSCHLSSEGCLGNWWKM